MSMKLLPAALDPVDPPQGSDVSNGASKQVSDSLVPVDQRAIATRAGQSGLVSSTDTFTWSPRSRQGGVNWINATFVEDSESDKAGRSEGEYVSDWAWSFPAVRTVVAHYLSYAAGLASGSARLIDLYA
jgi:hypothetical protein